MLGYSQLWKEEVVFLEMAEYIASPGCPWPRFYKRSVDATSTMTTRAPRDPYKDKGTNRDMLVKPSCRQIPSPSAFIRSCASVDARWMILSSLVLVNACPICGPWSGVAFNSHTDWIGNQSALNLFRELRVIAATERASGAIAASIISLHNGDLVMVKLDA